MPRPLRAVLAATLALAVLPALARADDAAVLYDPDAVATVDLRLDDAAVAALRAAPKTYVKGRMDLVAGGRSFTDAAVEVKLKGHGTFRTIDGKAALRIKLPKGGAVLGLKGLTLNNLVQDDSLVHETLSYEVLRAAGVPAPRTGYAYARLNGEALGVYVNVERYDTVSLPRLFPGRATQHLYEGEEGADVTPERVADLSVEEGDEDDRGDLDRLVGGDLRYADMDQLTRLWAGEHYLGHWDGYSVWEGSWLPNNYYLHSDAQGVFRMLPSGTDQTLVWPKPFAEKPSEGGVLFRRCMAIADCRSRFAWAMRGVRDTVDGLDLPARIDALVTLLRPWVAKPTREAPRDWAKAVQDTRNFLSTQKRETAPRWLAANPPPATAPAPWAVATPTPTPSASPTATPTPTATASPSATPTPDPDGTPAGDGGAPGSGTPGDGAAPSGGGSAGAGGGAPGGDGGGVAGESDAAAARCVVPDVRGRTLTTARRRLRAAGCRPGAVTRRGARRFGAAHPGVRPRWRVRATTPGRGVVRPRGRIAIELSPRAGKSG